MSDGLRLPLPAGFRSESEARRTILYLMMFPAAFFFFAPYSESLFLLFIVASFWGARRKKWAVAGFAGLVPVCCDRHGEMNEAHALARGLLGRFFWASIP